jgi:hypothetical protein
MLISRSLGGARWPKTTIACRFAGGNTQGLGVRGQGSRQDASGGSPGRFLRLFSLLNPLKCASNAIHQLR